MPRHLTYRSGILESDVERAAVLYESAFGRKFAAAMPSRADRVAVITRGLVPEHCIAAYHESWLVGIAGFQTGAGSLTSGIGARLLVDQLGWWRGLRAIALLSLYERSPGAGELVMDGIVVDSGYRGEGIGSELLERVKAFARDRGLTRVRLDVIDDNPRARELYERRGFEATRSERYEFLRPVLGFGGSTTMVCQVAAAPCSGPERS